MSYRKDTNLHDLSPISMDGATYKVTCLYCGLVMSADNPDYDEAHFIWNSDMAAHVMRCIQHQNYRDRTYALLRDYKKGSDND